MRLRGERRERGEGAKGEGGEGEREKDTGITPV